MNRTKFQVATYSPRVSLGTALLAGIFMAASPAVVSAQNLTFAGAQSNVAVGALESPAGVALDSTGDIFFTDSKANKVSELKSGSSTIVSLGGTYVWNSPSGIAVDSAGDVFVADAGNGRVEKLASGTGTPTAVGSGFTHPVSVALDTAGDLFVGDTTNHSVSEVKVGTNTPVAVGSGWSAPDGLALDIAGDLFVADSGLGQAYEVLAGTATKTPIASGWLRPAGIAVDPAGNVFVGDTGLSKVIEVRAGTGNLIDIGSGLASPGALAVNNTQDLFVADSTDAKVIEIQFGGVNFGKVNVCPSGQTTPAPCSQQLKLNYNVSSATTLSTPKLLPGDFVDAGGDTCSGTVSAGQCSVNVTFAPKLPGTRGTDVEILDSTSNLLASTYAYGLGSGPQIFFSPYGTVTIPVTGGLISGDSALALNEAGDIFIADYYDNRVVKLPAGGGSQTTVGSGLSGPKGVAVDAAGDVLIADTGNGRVVEVPSNGSPQITVASGLGSPTSVGADAAGDIFILAGGVIEVPANGGPQITVSSFVGTDLKVDTAGNIYVADFGGEGIFKIQADGAFTEIHINGEVYGLAVDSAGDLFFNPDDGLADLPATGGPLFLLDGLTPSGMYAMDAKGNLFATYNNSVFEFTTSQQPGLYIGSTPVGVPLCCGLPVTFQNIGNAPLVVSSLTVSPNFTQVPGGQTPADCTSNFSLVPGQPCNISISFTPQVVGPLSGAVTISDNALNANPGVMQSVALHGTGEPPLPAVVSLSPTSGSGEAQTFTALYSDPLGAADLKTVRILFNYGIEAADACYVLYDPQQNSMSLENDQGTGIGGSLTPGSGSISSGRCTLSGTGSSVKLSGNNMTVTYALSFASIGSVTQKVYLLAGSDAGSSGWVQQGTFTTLPGSPVVVSLSPTSGLAPTQAFTAVYYDPKGAADLKTLRILINSGILGAASCYVLYDPVQNNMSLENDAGNGTAGTLTPGSGSASNSQCTLSGAGSSVSTSGDNLTVTYALSFSKTFVGTQNVYLLAGNGTVSSGWVPKGTFSTSAGPAAVVSVSPDSGAGQTQAFTAVFSDPNGATALRSARFLVNTSIDAAHACYVLYDPVQNTMSLENDGGTGIAGSLTPGSGSAGNSQCTLAGAGSSVSAAGNTLTVVYALSFTSAFHTQQNLYLLDGDRASSSGWVIKGNFTP